MNSCVHSQPLILISSEEATHAWKTIPAYSGWWPSWYKELHGLILSAYRATKREDDNGMQGGKVDSPSSAGGWDASLSSDEHAVGFNRKADYAAITTRHFLSSLLSSSSPPLFANKSVQCVQYKLHFFLTPIWLHFDHLLQQKLVL